MTFPNLNDLGIRDLSRTFQLDYRLDTPRVETKSNDDTPTPEKTTRPSQKTVDESRTRQRYDQRASQLRTRIEGNVGGYRAEPAADAIQAGTASLRRGHAGPQVEALQKKLNENGAKPPLDEDGLYGPKTRAQVIRYQKANGLAVDGVAGKNTLAALKLRGDEDAKTPESESTTKAPTNGTENESTTKAPTNGTENESTTKAPNGDDKKNESTTKAPTNDGTKKESTTKAPTKDESTTKAPTGDDKKNESTTKLPANDGKKNGSTTKAPTKDDKSNDVANNDSKTKAPSKDDKKNDVANNESKTKVPTDDGKKNESTTKAPTKDDKNASTTKAPTDDGTTKTTTDAPKNDVVEDVPDPVLTKAQFLDKYGDTSVRADTRLPGRAYLDHADVNDDGVISGREEWALAFKEVDRADKNGDAGSVDTRNAKVAASLASLDKAPKNAVGKKAYGDRANTIMSSKLEAGEPHASTASAYEGRRVDYLGRKLSDKVYNVTLGYGSAGDVNLVYDQKKDRFYKQQQNGPLVPLSPKERDDVRKNLANHYPSNEPTNWSYNMIYVGLFPKEANNLHPEFDF